MKNKNMKIHYDNKIFFLFLTIFLIGAGVFLFKYIEKEDCDTVDFEMIARSFTTGDLIEFKSVGDAGYKWEWNFGDKSESEFVSNTLHKYDSVGVYTITLKVNNSCTISKQLYIKERVYVKEIDYSQVPEISFPKTMRVGDVVDFTCLSGFATKWEWRFGETDDVDAISEKAQYIFEEEGSHKISLIVNDSLRHALIKTIVVLPKKDKRKRKKRRRDYVDDVLLGQIPDDPDADPDKESIEQDGKIKINRREAKKIIEDYAKGSIDYADIRHKFCSENIRVLNPENEVSSLKNFLTTIRGKKIKILNVSLYKNEKTGCVKTLIVNLKYKGSLFWRKY